MAGKFQMRTPSVLAGMESRDQKNTFSQFSQLTDNDVRSEMKANSEVPEIQYLPADMLTPLGFNDEVYGEIESDSEDLQATARDIAQVGIQEPLIVFKDAETGKFVILSGNRRFAASRIAKEKYPDQYREYRGGLPCIVQAAPENDRDLRMRMIKNNLQREKTPFVRMREIAVYSQMVTDQQEQQEGETNIREVICRDLGVSQSEVTRYLKISSALIPELMDRFAHQLLSTNVAHQLAGQSEDMQHYVAENWSFATPLTSSEMHNLMAKRTLAQYEPGTRGGDRTAKVPKYQLTDVREGVSALADRCDRLRQAADAHGSFNKRQEKKLLKQINSELEKLDLLMEALGQQ